MAFTNSPLVSYTRISPNRGSPRSHVIDTITIHCVVGQCSVEGLGSVFAPTSRGASSNYGVGADGRIGMYVEERDRSWCSSNIDNDNRAVTIEVASDTTHPYAVNEKAFAAMLDLVTDICKRNGIKKLVWSTNKSDRVNHRNGCNMTVHRDYAQKACPGDYLYSRHGEIAAEVNRRLNADTSNTMSTTTEEPKTPAPTGTSQTAEIKVGDLVKIVGNSYYFGQTVPNWVLAKNWIVAAVSSGRVVVNKSEDGQNAIMSPFKASDLTLVRAAESVAPATAENPTNEKPSDENDKQSEGGDHAEPVVTVCRASDVIAVAQKELGYYEKASKANLDDKTSNAGHNNWTKYARDFDEKYPNWYNGRKNGFAWCDMFVDWCFITAFGYQKALYLLCQPEKSTGAGCSFSLGFFRAKGRFYTSNPKPGDQIFFGSSTSDVWHTGLVEKVDGSKVYTIEGNTSDMVARRTYSLNDGTIVGYGRPDYEGATKIVNTTSAASVAYNMLRIGSVESAVEKLQRLLIKHGYNPGPVDGDFGAMTYAAVIQFQKDYNLEVDGVVGPITWAALLKE